MVEQTIFIILYIKEQKGGVVILDRVEKEREREKERSKRKSRIVKLKNEKTKGQREIEKAREKDKAPTWTIGANKAFGNYCHVASD